MADPQTITRKNHSDGGGPVNPARQRTRRHEEEDGGGTDEHPGMGNHVVTPGLESCKTAGCYCRCWDSTLEGGTGGDSIPCILCTGTRE